MDETTSIIPTIPGTTLVSSAGGLPSISRMHERIAQQKAMRAVLKEYVKSEMDPQRHFYSIGDGGKPALSQDGARNLCSLYEVQAGETRLEEQYEETGHYSCKATVTLVSLNTGAQLGQGTGSCSTKESKYAWRWAWPNEVPAHLDKRTLRTRQTRNKQTLYRVPNEDLADHWNTVLKMAEKRALVAATLRLPMVSEIFDTSAEGEDPQDSTEEQDRKGLLRQVGTWLRTLHRDVRLASLPVFFRVTTLDEVQQLSYEQLDMALVRIDALENKVQWNSPTLLADIQGLEKQSAQQAVSDLFGDRPGTSQPEDADTIPFSEEEPTDGA